MKPENAIEVHGLTKKFKVYYDKGNQLKERMLFWKRNRYEIRNVLDGIDFEVKKGEAIGLVGHNGCGKSTTLKLLTRIMYPDSGTIEMQGRVSSLIELGAGFHPDMSGRENIYTNASIFGLTRKEIDDRVDDIIRFSELGKHIDNPVRTYSSGMYMRLAFSVAINVNADILLIDEILAVGDAGFQAKCFNKLKQIKADGTTIVIVSHSLGQVEQICDRSIWIHDGHIQAQGAPRDVHPEYLTYMAAERAAIAKQEVGMLTFQVGDSSKRWGNGQAHIDNVIMKKTSEEEETYNFTTGDDVDIIIDYTVKERIEDAVVGIGIFRSDGTQCYGTNTRIDRMPNFDLAEDGRAIVHIENLSLLPGYYLLDATLEYGMGIPVDYWREVIRFEVFSEFDDVGVSRLNHNWNLTVYDKES